MASITDIRYNSEASTPTCSLEPVKAGFIDLAHKAQSLFFRFIAWIENLFCESEEADFSEFGTEDLQETGSGAEDLKIIVGLSALTTVAGLTISPAAALITFTCGGALIGHRVWINVNTESEAALIVKPSVGTFTLSFPAD